MACDHVVHDLLVTMNPILQLPVWTGDTSNTHPPAQMKSVKTQFVNFIS